MHSLSSRFTGLAIAAAVSALGACGGSRGPAPASDARSGTIGLTYGVTVYRPTDGSVTSVPAGIDCGPTTTACTATFPWSTAVTLTATPKPGLMFGTWAGECGDSDACVLSTAQYGADKYVVAVFGPVGLTTHGNFLNPAVHGWEFKKWIDTKDGAPDPVTTPHFNCTACHGANYQGLGLAPSCTKCHAQNGHPNWLTECGYCHGQPPPQNPATPELRKVLYANPSANGTHPTVGTALTGCYGCHHDTVDPDGTLKVGGTHMNGAVDARGHAVPYPVSQHGPAFLTEVAANGTQTSCAGCHGASYDVDPGNGKVCNTCHATAIASWGAGGSSTSRTNWQQNCTFCHGLRTPNYDASSDIKLSGPPDDVAQRLDPAGGERLARTGQHQIHVLDGGNVPLGNAGSGLPCTACHAQPASIAATGHITADLIAPVEMTGAGAFPGLSPDAVAKLPNPLVTYDRKNASCAGYCHGSAAWGGNNTTMIWTDDFSTPIQGCNDCHGQPPPTGSLVKTTFTNACASFPNGCNDHTYHARIANRSPYLYDSCANCHFGSANGPYGGLHVNGKTDIVFTPAGTPGYKAFTATWDAVTKSCTASCHTTSGTGVVT